MHEILFQQQKTGGGVFEHSTDVIYVSGLCFMTTAYVA